MAVCRRLARLVGGTAGGAEQSGESALRQKGWSRGASAFPMTARLIPANYPPTPLTAKLPVFLAISRG